jgi:hypothetical protein
VTNLFEMMMQAQGGHAMQNMARQFGLAPEQTQKAVEAVLPAFQLGLQKQAETMDGLQKMIMTMATGPFASIHGTEAEKVPEEAVEKGDDVLKQIFGGEEVSRAVAAQAAAMSGISDAIIKQMLPIVAAMLMGGLFKGAVNSGLGSAFGHAMQGNFGNAMSEMMRAGQPAPPPNPFQSMTAAGMMNPMFGAMMGQKPAPPDPMAAGMEMLKGMFDAGQQAQKSQMAAFQAIFEQFSGRR